MRHALCCFFFLVIVAAAQPLAERIVHYDPGQHRVSKGPHQGAGELHYTRMYDRPDIATNLLFLHRGVIMPGSSIGHHFHNRMEEMFVILDGEAQFTIDGRTAVLKGPAGAPCRMGHAHAIYNHTGKPVQWMNIAVSTVRHRYDAVNVGDDRAGARVDPKPVFMHMLLRRANLRDTKSMDGGKGTVHYRRALPPQLFRTNWAYVDHVVIPPGASIGAHSHQGIEELNYVIAGEGTVRVDDESAGIRKDDALIVELNQVHSFENTGSG
ncbi:MAG: cupin domain-containing protein, partial [bacterium]|nr:cupin domain-containing protein [bacterium]